MSNSFFESPPRRRLRGLPSPQSLAPLAWYTAERGHARSGFGKDWGWLISAGQTSPYLAKDDPAQPERWVELAHQWMLDHQHEANAGIPLLKEWHAFVTDAFSKAHPGVIAKNPSAGPWLDAAIVEVKRLSSGMRIEFRTTGMTAIGLHWGANEKWVLSPSMTWHRQHFDAYKTQLHHLTFESAKGKKLLQQWHDDCRLNLNVHGRRDGLSAWIVGNPLEDWVHGQMHVSETPVSVVFYNLGALALVDLYGEYPSHKDIFDYIRTHKRMDVLLEKMQAYEDQDPTGKKYARPMPRLPVAILSAHGE